MLATWSCSSGRELEAGATEAHEPAQTSLPKPTPLDSAPPGPDAQREAGSSQALELDAPWIRVAWTRDVGDGTDVISFGDRLVLMAHDSRDGQGERVLVEPPASYAKPLVTPSGAEVVYSVRDEGAVYAIRWDGSGRRRLASGFGLAVWPNPGDGDEWVYVGDDEEATDPPAYHSIYRYPLADPSQRELVWNAQPVSGDGFQVSADGRHAGGLFPWPKAGVADLAAGTWQQLGDGCWTAFSVDGPKVFWYFDGAHRNLTLVDMESEQRWQVGINGAPGIDGFEVWHPRWTNDSRYFVMTGPYTVGQRANKIRGGGNQVEIYLGEFADDFTSVRQWRQVTHNDAPDFYPDAWVQADDRNRPAVRPSLDTAAPDAAGTRLVVEARVRRDAELPTPESIAPYRHGLLALEYDVVQVLEGHYDESTLVVAHWVIRDRTVLDTAARAAGSTLRMTLERYDTHPELEGERLVMDTNAFTLPLYYDVASLP